MSKRVLAWLLVGVSLGWVAGCSAPLRVSEDFSLSHPWGDYERVEVRTRNGSLKLSSEAIDEVSIDGTKHVQVWSLAESSDRLAELEIRVGPHATRGDTLVIELHCSPVRPGTSPGASFTVCVPEPCEAELRTGNGRIDVARMGRTRADTSNGRIHVRDIDGGLRADTSNGRIDVANVRGECRLETSNGRVEARGIEGPLEVRTSNGRIYANVVPEAGDDIKLRSSNGGIHLSIPEDCGAHLELHTSNGKVHTNLGAAMMRHVEVGRCRFAAELNGGGGEISISTSNGSIHLDAE